MTGYSCGICTKSAGPRLAPCFFASSSQKSRFINQSKSNVWIFYRKRNFQSGDIDKMEKKRKQNLQSGSFFMYWIQFPIPKFFDFCCYSWRCRKVLHPISGKGGLKVCLSWTLNSYSTQTCLDLSYLQELGWWLWGRRFWEKSGTVHPGNKSRNISLC